MKEHHSRMDASKTTILLGGPGCGKTTRLLNTVEEALAAGVAPEQVTFVSFTKKATDEGRARASERFNLPPERFRNFKTLHSMAFRTAGMRRDRVLNWQHLNQLGRSLGLEFKGKGQQVAEDDVYGMGSADRLLFLEGLARNTKRPLNDVWKDAFEDAIDWFELERFARALESFKRKNLLYDFTDMIDQFITGGSSSADPCKLLIVDEVQDLSSLQWDMVEILASKAERILVAGDDCQSVYRWSGADVDHFINLPGTQKDLEQSHRVPRKVHSLANALTDRIANKRKRVWLPKNELGDICWYNSVDEVDMSRDTWLLLARNGYMLSELEDHCLSQGLSFHSINRDPLKSPALQAIRIWEDLRKGLDRSCEHVLEMLRFMGSRNASPVLVKKLKADQPNRMVGLPELLRTGLGTNAIWHEALEKISPRERDYFIAARRRGESLVRQPRISISTIHASKGGEADNVLLLTDMSYRCYSNMESNMDDELRVFFVATTRCRHNLHLISPKSDLYFEL